VTAKVRPRASSEAPSAAIPSEDVFGESEFYEAEDLTALGRHLIQKHAELNFLVDFRVRFLWKLTGGGHNGRKTLGRCRVTDQLVRYFAQADWVIWLAADYLAEYEFSDRQVEALLYHEMLHCRLGGREGDTPGIRGHDVEIFGGELVRYGLWEEGLEVLASQIRRAEEMGRRR